jgi:hypothetical protein
MDTDEAVGAKAKQNVPSESSGTMYFFACNGNNFPSGK